MSWLSLLIIDVAWVVLISYLILTQGPNVITVICLVAMSFCAGVAATFVSLKRVGVLPE